MEDLDAWMAGDAAQRLIHQLDAVDAFLADRRTIISPVNLALVETVGAIPLDLGSIGVLTFDVKAGAASVTEVTTIWDHLTTTRIHPIVAARAARNLWTFKVAGVMPPHVAAATAIELFEQVANEQHGLPSDRAEALAAAIEVAIEVGNASGDLERLIPEAFERIDVALAAAPSHQADAIEQASMARRDDPSPITLTELHQSVEAASIECQHHDTALVLVRSLVAATKSKRARTLIDTQRLPGCVDQLAELCATSDRLSELVHSVRLDLAGSDMQRRRTLITEHIERASQRVDRRNTPALYFHLTRWEREASDAGLTELAERLQVELQSISPQLERHRTEAPIPDEVAAQLRRYIESLTESADLATQLRTIVMHPGAAWRYTTATMSDLPAPPPIATSLPSITIGNENTLRRTTQEGVDDLEARAVRHHWGRTQADLLHIVEPSLRTALANRIHTEIADTIVAIAQRSGLLDDTTARSSAAAIIDWLEDRTDAATHTLTPRIERVIRTEAKRRGISVITTARTDRPGTHDTLGVVLDNLADHVDPDLRLHMQWTLNHDAGPNLRNQIAHGDIAHADNMTAVTAVATFLVAVFGLHDLTDSATATAASP